MFCPTVSVPAKSSLNVRLAVRTRFESQIELTRFARIIRPSGKSEELFGKIENRSSFV
jgi:hypothetical protein